MKHFKSFTLLFTLLLSINVQAASVWKVSKGNSTLYLTGTMHFLSPDDYPLPDAFKVAYEASSSLVFETDLDAFNTPEMQQLSMQLMTYTDGTTIDQVLNEETLTALKAHLDERGIPFGNFKPFKPSMLSLTLTIIEFQRMGLTPMGVDQFYYTRAMGDGKQRKWLETPEEQLNFLANMAMGDENEMIMYTLEDIKTLPTKMTEMKQAWRKGNMKRLVEIGMDPWKDDYPELFDAMLINRNNNWMPQIKKMLETPEVEMILVGALHLPAEGGLIEQIQALGYTVEKLAVNK